MITWHNRNKYFIFLVTALNLTIVAEFFFAASARNAKNILTTCLLHGLFVLAFAVFVALLSDCIFRKTVINRIFKAVFLIISIVMFFIDIFSLYFYECRLDKGMLNVILGTKYAEANEFFVNYITQPGFLMCLAIVLLCIVCAGWVYSQLSKTKIFAVVILVVAVISAAVGIHKKFIVRDYLSPFRIISMSWGVYRENAELEEMLKSSKKEIKLTRNESSIPNFVFILGESTSRHHMSLYGYDLPTNPKLTARKDHGELFLFTDVTSPNAQTIPVMEKLFTFYNHETSGKWFTYTNLFSILRSAGYKTIWLSNQETMGKYSTAGKFYANQGDIGKFLLVWDSYTLAHNYDGDILPALDAIISESDIEKLFYVIHLLGTHADYALRYPSEYSKFTASDEDGKGIDGLTEAQKKIRAEYDNAVLYNDFIVDEIIKRFEDKNAIVIYISDHGEEVYDTRKFHGHSERNSSRFMLEIPMMIWTSSELRKNYPALCTRISKSTEKAFMTDNMIHGILDIMQIETGEYDASMSFLEQ